MRRRIQRARETQDRWLVSYADFITLLFAFFVVLYSFAKADQKKQIQVTASIDAAFRTLSVFPRATRLPADGDSSAAGVETPALPVNIVMGEEAPAPARVKEDLDRIRRELEQTLSKEVAAHIVSIHMGRDGLVISLREAGFFRSGSATPGPEALFTLRHVAASLSRAGFDLRVEGHTDNVPIHTAEFDSNWELSAARATSIARLFLGLRSIPPDRISAAGYAEFHPIADNNTADGRAENRRVDLVVLPRISLDLSVLARTDGPWRRITDPN